MQGRLTFGGDGLGMMRSFIFQADQLLAVGAQYIQRRRQTADFIGASSPFRRDIEFTAGQAISIVA